MMDSISMIGIRENTDPEIQKMVKDVDSKTNTIYGTLHWMIHILWEYADELENEWGHYSDAAKMRYIALRIRELLEPIEEE
jgi:hypothetical protein